MKDKLTIALTGHRPDKLDGYTIKGSVFYVELYKQLQNRLIGYLRRPAGIALLYTN